jgi:glycosyltransferase involved in cell wall biosynthesis
MRFAFISTMSGAPWGGSEELWSRAAIRLREDGHSVSASVSYWPLLAPRITALAESGINVNVRRPKRSHIIVRVWNKVMRKFGKESLERARLRRQKPDLVVISMGEITSGLEWMKCCMETNLQFVAISQCNSEQFWPRDDVGAEMAGAYRAARKVFCVSHHNLALLERQIGTELPNARVIWNPYNVSPHDPPAWPADSSVWRLACVARLEPAAKGQDVLFEVLSRPQWPKRSVEINLYGDGFYAGSLRRLANRLQLRNVHFRGHVEDVRHIWEENHLLILPSRYEGLPLALVEAMWCGRPAVVTDVGGNTELCVDDKTGFVAAAPTVGLLEQALDRAWNRRYEWQDLGRAARARAEELIPKNPVEEVCLQLMGCASSLAAVSRRR